MSKLVNASALIRRHNSRRQGLQLLAKHSLL